MPATSDRELIETWQDEPAPLLPLLHAAFIPFGEIVHQHPC